MFLLPKRNKPMSLLVTLTHFTTSKESACKIICMLYQQTSSKRRIANNVNMTSHYDVANSLDQVTTWTIRHSSILEFDRGASNQAVTPGTTWPLHATGRMQELRKSQIQVLRADPAWSINSGKMESNPGDFPGFRRLRAAASSSGLKGSEVLWPAGVGIFHRSDSSLLSGLVDLRSPVLCAPFFTSCEAMEFAETGHWWKDRPDLPVSLLMVLHAMRLECEKSMEFTASSHRSCFCPSRDSRDEAALSESVPGPSPGCSSRGGQNQKGAHF